MWSGNIWLGIGVWPRIGTKLGYVIRDVWYVRWCHVAYGCILWFGVTSGGVHMLWCNMGHESGIWGDLGIYEGGTHETVWATCGDT